MKQTCSRCRSAFELPGHSTRVREYVCPACRDELPERFGKYSIHGFIGAGGVGRVYKGTHPDLGRTVAIKVLQAGEGIADEVLLRFQNEARVASTLLHPNIVQVYDTGTENGEPYIVMEYVEGRSLSELLEEGLDFARGLAILREIARAIEYAHERGVIHRDIKPSNVLVDSAGRPRILDFGIAKSDTEVALTRTGDMLGTPLYMAPEQAAGRHKSVDRRSDVYALGAMLYEMATGRPPLTADSLMDLLRRLPIEKPRRPSELRAGLPRAVDEVCLRALEKDPALRHPGAAEFGADLEKLLAGSPVVGRRPATLWPILGAAAALAVVVAIVVFRKPKGPEPVRRDPPAPERPQVRPRKEDPENLERARRGHYGWAAWEEKDPFLKVLYAVADTRSMFRFGVPGFFWLDTDVEEAIGELKESGRPAGEIALLRAILRSEHGDFVSADPLLEEARGGGPSAEELRFAEGVISVQRILLIGDAGPFERWSAALPASPEAWLRALRAFGLAFLGRAESVAVAESLPVDAPESALALAVAHQHLGGFDKAEEYARSANALSKNIVDTRQYRMFLRVAGALRSGKPLASDEAAAIRKELDERALNAPEPVVYLLRSFFRALACEWKGLAEDLARARRSGTPDRLKGVDLLRRLATEGPASKLAMLLRAFDLQRHFGDLAATASTAEEVLRLPLEGADARPIRAEMHRTLALRAAGLRDDAAFYRHLEEALRNGYSATGAAGEGGFAEYRKRAEFKALLDRFRK